jgi:hypothetical protein
LFEVYYKDHVQKSENGVDEFFYGLCKFAFENGDAIRMERLFERIIE